MMYEHKKLPDFFRNKSIFLLLFLWSFSAVFAQSARVYVNKELSRIREVERSGNAEQALKSCRALYEKYPKNSALFNYYKNLCFRTENYPEAVRVIRKRLEFYPDDEILQCYLASALYKSGAKKDAFSLWNKIIRQSGKETYIYQIVANSMAQERLYSKAASVLIKGKERTNKPGILSLSLIDLYLSNLDYKSAAKEMCELLLIRPGHYNFIKSRLKRLPASSGVVFPMIKQINKYSEKNQENIPIKKLLSLLYIKAELYKKAVKIEQDIYSLERKKSISRFVNLAETLINKQQYRLAADLLNSIKDKSVKERDKTGILYLKAVCYEKSGQYKEAAEAYKSIADDRQKTPEAAHALLKCGIILSDNLKNQSEALSVFKRVYEDYKGTKEAEQSLFLIGRCELIQGNIKSAKEHFEKQKKQSPEKNELWVKSVVLLGKTLYFTGKPEQSYKILKELTSQGISDKGLQSPELNDGLDLYMLLMENLKKNRDQLIMSGRAEYLKFSGKDNSAIAVIDSLQALYPASTLTARALIIKSSILFSEGQTGKAILVLKQVQNKFKGSDFAEKALERQGYFLQKDHKLKEAVIIYEEFLEKYPQSLLAGEIRNRLRLIREAKK